MLSMYNSEASIPPKIRNMNVVSLNEMAVRKGCTSSRTVEKRTDTGVTMDFSNVPAHESRSICHRVNRIIDSGKAKN